MRQTRVLKISHLQPIEYRVSFQRLREIEQGTSRCSDFPEVWRIYGLLILVDGHNRVYHAFQKGQDTVRVNYHSPRNTLLTRKGYEYALEGAVSAAAFLRDAGIFNISQLQVQ